MKEKVNIAVLGDGGWGTALAVVGARNKNAVMLWSAFPEYAEVLKKKRENIKFLPGVTLSDEIQITSDLKEAIAFADIIVLAIPTQFLRNILYKVKASWSLEAYISFCLKLILACGLIFEMPIASAALAKIGLISANSLRKYRRYAILGTFIIAALITPPDVFSQTLLALPMLALYEISILTARYFEPALPKENPYA